MRTASRWRTWLVDLAGATAALVGVAAWATLLLLIAGG
jgi:hypothetical protein